MKLRHSESIRAGAVLTLCLLCLNPTGSFGARPFVTDDARIVDPGGCQIESFIKRQRRHPDDEFWFLPACTPSGLVELTVGGNRVNNVGTDSASSAILQAKTLLRELRPNDYGLAITIGASKSHPIDAATARGWAPYLNLVGSLSLLSDRVVMHTNLGSTVDRAMSRTRATWGLGADVSLNPRLYGIVEAYGQEADRPNAQLGLRYWVVPNRLQLDATFGGQRADTRSRSWTSFGVRALF